MLCHFLDGLRCHGPTMVYKYFTFMLPFQIHLSHFNLGSLIDLLVVLMFFSGHTLRDVGVHMMHFYNQLLQTGSNILPQWGSPHGFASVLQGVSIPLQQPPPQGIRHHPGVSVKTEHWPPLSTGNV